MPPNIPSLVSSRTPALNYTNVCSWLSMCQWSTTKPFCAASFCRVGTPGKKVSPLRCLLSRLEGNRGIAFAKCSAQAGMLPPLQCLRLLSTLHPCVRCRLVESHLGRLPTETLTNPHYLLAAFWLPRDRPGSPKGIPKGSQNRQHTQMSVKVHIATNCQRCCS